VLVGNQSDRAEERQVDFEQGERLQRDLKMSFFFETSVKLGENVENVNI
jgi:GTPase SAR1 family protein